VCPTSNVRTGVCRSHDEHPVRQLLEAGVPITINTDDPTFFATTLADELAHVEAAGVDEQAILELAINGFRHAFLPPADIEAYVERLRAAWAARGDSGA
jgi:adenosine deaminase